MTEMNDMDLVRDYARRNSESAFAKLVQRHINLVYSVAMRYVGNSMDAQDVTQAVFIILAKKAAGLRDKTIITGWLYETTRFTAINFLRSKIRRESREQEAHMQSTLNDSDTAAAWQQVAPLLEDAMTRLSEKERTLLALHFFENKSGAETAAALGIEEWAARKRVARAVEKLRKFFTQRGVGITASVLIGAITTNSVQAAPTALATSISAVAITKGAVVSGSTLTLVKGALKIMAWTKAKMAIAVGVGVLLAAGTTTVAVKKFRSNSDADKYFVDMTWETFQKAPPYFIVRPTHFDKPNHIGTSAMGSNSRAVGRNMDLESMIHYAYNFHNRTRTVSPDGKFPTGGFDFLVTVPDAPKKFQAEIKKQFGYEAHQKILNVDALVLRVSNPNAPGLKVSDRSDQSRQGNKFAIDWTGYQISEMVGQIETWLAIPVVDQTRLTGNYSVQLDWERGSSDEAKAKLRQAVLDQLGLELIPTNMPIEMLVVEKVK